MQTGSTATGRFASLLIFISCAGGHAFVLSSKHAGKLRGTEGAWNATAANSTDVFASLSPTAQATGRCSLVGDLIHPDVSPRCCFSIQVATQRGLSEYGMAQPCKGAWRCQADGVTPEVEFEEQARREVCADPKCLSGVTTAMKASWKTAQAAHYMDALCDPATVSVQNGTKEGLIRASLEGMDVEALRRRRRRPQGNNSDDSSRRRSTPKPACFPAEAEVEVDGSGRVPVANLRRGDLVLTAHPEVGALPGYEPVLDFIHISRGQKAPFITIYHEHGIFRASAGHLVFAASASTRDKYFDMPAGVLKTGDMLFALSASNGTQQGLVPSRIIRVDDSSASLGMYAPLTRTGTIIVDGVVASNYATPSLEVRLPHWLAHAGLFPVRTFHALGLARLFAAVKEVFFEVSADADVVDVMHPYFGFLFKGLGVHRLLQKV